MSPTNSTDPLVVVAILNWNRPSDTLACLEALQRSDYDNVQVVVVDNASQDDSVARVSRLFPHVRILCNPSNLGYAGGNNTAILYALQQGAQHILLLNNDAKVEKDALARMVEAAAPDVAAVSGRVLRMDQPHRLWAAGEPFPRGKFPLDGGPFDQPRDLAYAVGCCILLSSQAVRRVGMLDPEYFMLHEEKEWCYRARATGYRIRYEPRAIIYHQLSFSSGNSPGYHYLYVRNQLRFYQKHDSSFRQDWRRATRALWLFQEEVRYILSNGADKSWRIQAAWRGAMDFLHNRFGPPPEDIALRK